MTTEVDVFNIPALVIGALTLLFCLAMQGSTVALVMAIFKPRIRSMVAQKRNIAGHAMFFASILTLLMAHLLQISVWAAVLDMVGGIANPHQAVLLAGSTLTTVGFANDTLPQQWQLFTVIMAVTGLFAFAWSTSIMYALSQQLYPSED